MKLYVVYFRTMQDSPEVKIVSLTTSKKKADEKFAEAKKWEEEWMADEDEESGNWAEACIMTTIVSEDTRPGDMFFAMIETDWVEEVSTSIKIHGSDFWAEKGIEFRKRKLLEDDPNLVPYDEDDTIEESMHLHNPDVMSDYYFSIEPRIVE
jgi:hypothetical protein